MCFFLLHCLSSFHHGLLQLRSCISEVKYHYVKVEVAHKDDEVVGGTSSHLSLKLGQLFYRKSRLCNFDHCGVARLQLQRKLRQLYPMIRLWILCLLHCWMRAMAKCESLDIPQWERLMKMVEFSPDRNYQMVIQTSAIKEPGCTFCISSLEGLDSPTIILDTVCILLL
jgi:hypothetical protein